MFIYSSDSLLQLQHSFVNKHSGNRLDKKVCPQSCCEASCGQSQNFRWILGQMVLKIIFFLSRLFNHFCGFLYMFHSAVSCVVFINCHWRCWVGCACFFLFVCLFVVVVVVCVSCAVFQRKLSSCATVDARIMVVSLRTNYGVICDDSSHYQFFLTPFFNQKQTTDSRIRACTERKKLFTWRKSKGKTVFFFSPYTHHSPWLHTGSHQPTISVYWVCSGDTGGISAKLLLTDDDAVRIETLFCKLDDEGQPMQGRSAHVHSSKLAYWPVTGDTQITRQLTRTRGECGVKCGLLYCAHTCTVVWCRRRIVE